MGQIDKPSLNVLYKICKCNSYSMTQWLNDEEFSDRMYEILNAGGKFSNAGVLEVMTQIYNDRDKDRERYPEFNFSATRQAIHQMRRYEQG